MEQASKDEKRQTTKPSAKSFFKKAKKVAAVAMFSSFILSFASFSCLNYLLHEDRAGKKRYERIVAEREKRLDEKWFAEISEGRIPKELAKASIEIDEVGQRYQLEGIIKSYTSSVDLKNAESPEIFIELKEKGETKLVTLKDAKEMEGSINARLEAQIEETRSLLGYIKKLKEEGKYKEAEEAFVRLSDYQKEIDKNVEELKKFEYIYNQFLKVFDALDLLFSTPCSFMDGLSWGHFVIARSPKFVLSFDEEKDELTGKFRTASAHENEVIRINIKFFEEKSDEPFNLASVIVHEAAHLYFDYGQINEKKHPYSALAKTKLKILEWDLNLFGGLYNLFGNKEISDRTEEAYSSILSESKRIDEDSSVLVSARYMEMRTTYIEKLFFRDFTKNYEIPPEKLDCLFAYEKIRYPVHKKKEADFLIFLNSLEEIRGLSFLAALNFCFLWIFILAAERVNSFYQLIKELMGAGKSGIKQSGNSLEEKSKEQGP
ncbi:MAG: hypothetical protein QW035_02960 [Candidatus Anstonellales archaeon]